MTDIKMDHAESFNNIVNFDGKIIRDNDTYQVIDNELLNHLILSKTILYPGKETNGHKHEGKEEVYYITKGEGIVQLDETKRNVSAGDIILIKDGMFHKMINLGNTELEFVCVFEKYIR